MKHKSLSVPALILAAILLLSGAGLWGHAESDVRRQQSLDVFHSIDLNVKSADVTLVHGDEFSIDFRLHPREPVTRLEVADGTLFFETGFDLNWKGGFGGRFITITVPEDTAFESVRIHSTAGTLRLSDFSVRNGDFKTTAGEIHLERASFDTLSARTVADDILLTDSTVTDRAHLETVAGNITANAPFASVQAESIGKIRLNGAEQGRRLSLGEGQPALSAKSVSGRIDITSAPPTTAS